MISILLFILGLLWGSFFNVCIIRLPQEKSIVWGRSACPQCHKLIPWYYNIPLVSYAILLGKCNQCKTQISWQYPLIELITGLLFVGLYLHFGLTLEWIFSTIFCSSLLVISVIDLYHQIIPDEISLSGIVVGFLFSFWLGKISWIESLSGILVGGGIFLAIAWGYEKMTQREGLGGGDIKLLAMIGAWLGVQSLLVVIITSSLLGSVVGIGTMLFLKKDFKTAIPFGPFLAVGALVYLFWGEQVQQWIFPNWSPQ